MQSSSDTSTSFSLILSYGYLFFLIQQVQDYQILIIDASRSGILKKKWYP